MADSGAIGIFCGGRCFVLWGAGGGGAVGGIELREVDGVSGRKQGKRAINEISSAMKEPRLL